MIIAISDSEDKNRPGSKIPDSPHPSSSDPSRQSRSPSQTWLKRTHSVPSWHNLEPMRHFRTFDRAVGWAMLWQLTSSEPSLQWERPSQTRLLEMQLLRSLQRKSSRWKLLKISFSKFQDALKALLSMLNFLNNIWGKGNVYHHHIREHNSMLTFWGTSFHTVLFVKAIRTVFVSIAKLAWRNAEVNRRTGTEHRGAAAGWDSRIRRFGDRWHFVEWNNIWCCWSHRRICGIFNIE